MVDIALLLFGVAEMSVTVRAELIDSNQRKCLNTIRFLRNE